MLAAPRQTYPAEHGAVGAVRPAEPQKLPPLHGVHSLTFCSPVTAENRPAGQGYWWMLLVLSGQTYPAGQMAGLIVPDTQYERAVHGLHTARPVTSAKLPAGHGCGTLVPATHALPVGHGVLGLATPPVHTYPASHGAVGVTVAEFGHLKPGVHGRHWLSLPAPVALLKVPGGHGIGAALPMMQ